MNKISALIVEDDTVSLNILRSQIRTHLKNINILGVAKNISDAISSYKQLRPQIIFLDINLGGENSFSMLDDLKKEAYNPQVVFTTSTDEFAVKAIKYAVTDYVLKPISPRDLIKAVNKAVHNIESFIKMEALKRLEKKSQEYPKIIAIPYIDKIELIKFENILYCEADGRYTKFHLINGDTKVASRNLGEYEKLLDKNLFFRVHHSYIVNILMIHHINKLDGNYCHLMNHKTLPIAKRRQDELNRFLNLK
ncbi:LytTR family DNA-binding domain-containing protein [Flavivirga aquimarina]|uniref:LytTR family DNA-binding domain-containing protein n=1 Tax=Flavivirga aquimarina TaxID=2027862 RepID=A0ABT8W700_9FLAO|nr:LytTR family DNA-binding domain-containing protein [Flavivirga aquimarina]MDO5968897.1 LytTR family DNA-binding domain-containing protein [Flavivirga aquimarina]